MTQTLILLLSIIGTLIISGGLIFKSSSLRIELSQVDPFGFTFLLLLFICFIFSKKSLLPLKKKGLALLEWSTVEKNSHFWSFIFIIFNLLLLFIAHLFMQWSLKTAAFDQTTVHQSLFYSFGTIPLKCDICRGPSYLSEHLSFSLFILSPLTQLLKIDEFIFFIQIIILSLSLFILFHFTPLRNQKKLWLVFSLLLFSHRSLRDSFVTFFREDHIAFIALICSLASLFNKKIYFYCIFIFIALLSKENIAFILPFILIPLYLDPQTKPNTKVENFLIMFFTLIIPLIYIFLSFKILIPHYSVSASGHTPFVSRLSFLGHNPNEILQTVVFQPFYTLKTLFLLLLTKESIKYLILIFLPYSFLFTKSWYWTIPALPSIFLNMSSTLKTQISQQFHYDLVILPFLIFGLISALSKANPNKIKSQLSFFLIFALCFSGRWPGFHVTSHIPSWDDIKESISLRKLPQIEKPIAASERILAQLSYQKNIVLYGYFNPEHTTCDKLIEKLKANTQNLKHIPQRFLIDSQSPLHEEKLFFNALSECLLTLNISQYQYIPKDTKRFIYFEY